MSSVQTRFDPVLCDLDGTVVDSASGIVASIQAVARADHLTIPPGLDLASIIGLPLDQIFSQLAPVAETPRLIREYRRHYESRALPSTRAMPGAVETIGELHRAGIKMAVVTHKPLIYAEQILDATRLRRFFLVVVGQSMIGQGRSKTEMIQEALDRLGAPIRPVYVGDHEEDERAAGEASIPFLPFRPDDWPTLKRRILVELDG